MRLQNQFDGIGSENSAKDFLKISLLNTVLRLV